MSATHENVIDILAHEIEKQKDAYAESEQKVKSLKKELSELQENYDSMLAKVNECEQAELRRQKEFEDALDSIKNDKDLLVSWRRSHVDGWREEEDKKPLTDVEWEEVKDFFDENTMDIEFRDELARLQRMKEKRTVDSDDEKEALEGCAI